MDPDHTLASTSLVPPLPHPSVRTPPRCAPTRLLVPDGPLSGAVVEIGSHEMTVDGRAVRFDEITHIAYSTRRRTANLVQRRRRRRVWVRSRTGTEIEIVTGVHAFGTHHDDACSVLHRCLVGVLHHDVERRLRAEVISRLRSGEQIEIGPLVLAPTTVTAVDRHGRRHRSAWRDAPSAELDGHRVLVSAERNDGRPLVRISADEPNAVLLPELLISAGVLC